MMRFDWRAEWAKRPWCMNAMLAFCAYMTFLYMYMPFDVFVKPVAVDDEVWFGVRLHGWAAKATEPLHWAIYAAGAYGFWTMRRWMWPSAAVYTAQICIGMFVWNLLDPHGRGWVGASIAAGLFAIPGIALWRARPAFAN